MSADDIIILTKLSHQRLPRPYNTAVNLAELQEMLQGARDGLRQRRKPHIRTYNVDTEDTVMRVTKDDGTTISFYAFHEHRNWI